jgi:hypothetical protein
MSQVQQNPADGQGIPVSAEETKIVDEVVAAQDAFREKVAGRPAEDDDEGNRNASWLTPVA